MKIYILPVNTKLQPASQKFEYPAGNADYGVEQDFLEFLQKSSYLTSLPDQADWHYLPIYWTRWHLNHSYGQEGLGELSTAVSQTIIDTHKTFTICQYDDGPVIDLGQAKLFLSSRKGKKGSDIPLLRNLLKRPSFKPRKRFLATFVGRLNTHPIRQKMADALKSFEDVMISDGDRGQGYFIDNTLRSYVSLCPRGYGGSSFRFFEAMQLGVVPVLIGNQDTRPFKKFIDWNSMSFFVKSAENLPKVLKNVPKAQLKAMGAKARKTYLKELHYGKWCKYVIKELESS